MSTLFMIEFVRGDKPSMTGDRHGYAFYNFETMQECVDYVFAHPEKFSSGRKGHNFAQIYDQHGNFPFCKVDFDSNRALWASAFATSQGR